MNTKNGYKKPQLEDIAAALGISKSTVSRAISGKGRIRAETRERVFECMREMNYRPNIIAKSLSEQKTYSIGVIMPIDSSEAEAPFYQACLMGITRECSLRDYNAVIIGTERHDYSQLERILEDRRIDGAIVTRPASDGLQEKLLSEYEMPFVVIGKSVYEKSATVDSDHTNGCKSLTSYIFLSTPPERVGLILGNTGYTVNKSRYIGFNEAFEKAGRVPNEQLIFTDIDSSLQFSKAVSMLLKQDPGCIICGDDNICMKLLSKLNETGISVPQDIKVASFYDSAYLDSYIPPITSLRFDSAELGIMATKRLYSIIDETSSSANTVQDYELLIRRSTI